MRAERLLLLLLQRPRVETRDGISITKRDKEQISRASSSPTPEKTRRRAILFILLLTIPPSVGYEQNPLSVYYCYDVEGTSTCLNKCIAKVTNTPWGERVSFIFNPHFDLVAKSFHVSPFMICLSSAFCWCHFYISR
ncbi:hypothetical protein HN51_007902 [Arachis hypogaea]